MALRFESDRAFNVLLRFVVDKETLRDVETGAKSTFEVVAGLQEEGTALALTAARLEPALVSQIKKTQELQNAWWKTQRVLRATSFVFTSITAAGLGILTPLIAMAGKFSADMGKAGGVLDPIASKWLKATESLKKSSMVVGKTTAQVLLPFLERLAVLAEKGARYVEQNPKVVEAALRIGAIITSIGVLGTLASQGIKLYVDVKFALASAQNYLAGRLMEKAAKDHLLASIQMMRAGALAKFSEEPLTYPTVGQAYGPLIVGALALTLGTQIGKIAGNEIAKKIYGSGYKEQGLGDAARTFIRMWSLPGQALTLWLAKLGVISEDTAHKVGNLVRGIDKFITKLFGLETQTEQTAAALEGLLAGSAHEKEIVEAYMKMIEEDKKAAEEFARQQQDILSESAKQMSDIRADFVRDLAKINADYNQTVSKLTLDYTRADTEAVNDLLYERSQIVRDSTLEIRRIEEDHQEKLRKMQMEHDMRIEELVGARDALGIVEEDRRFAMEMDEANRETNIEIARRRQETAQRLRELDYEFQVARAKRQADFIEKLKEAKAQRDAEILEKRKQLAEDIRRAREERDQKLRELQDEYNRERLARREAFIATVRDLDAALLGEKALKERYYALMLADAQKFLEAYRKKLPSSATVEGAYASVTSRQTGGYASGLTRLGEGGTPEFVLSGATTRAAEKALGGKLTQWGIMRGLRGGQQIININMANGMTLLQVQRALSESNVRAFNDLAYSLGG